MNRPLTKQEQFFYDNAGYSRNPKTQTEQQARDRNARFIEDKDGNAVDSLGMTEAPTREYRRVIEADLAIAIMPEVTK